MKRLFFLCVLVIVVAHSLLSQQIAQAQNDPVATATSSTSLKPLQVFTNPLGQLDNWSTTAIPLNSYSQEELEIQRQLNEKEAAVLAYAPEGDSSEWLPLDYEEITPYTWKWVSFRLQEENGTISEVSLRRPNWWILEHGAEKVTNKVFLFIPELGIEGPAIVSNILPSQLDTRLWEERRAGDYIFRPITGKFEYQTLGVSEYFFEEIEEPIRATPSHPFFSLDRKEWVPIGEIEIGERVRTRVGTAILDEEISLKGLNTVFNLEIFRDHNYLVSRNELLTHNKSCPSSKILGENLEAARYTRPPNSAAHHIVAGSDPRAASARKILEKAGIDINDAKNGVFLPRGSKYAKPGEIPHSRIHTNKYYREINKRLRRTNNIEAELEVIRNDILNNTFPY